MEQSKATQLASQAEADRNKELFEKKVISEKEFTNKTQLNESNLAKVKAAEAAVEQARLNLEYCKIVAPVDGIAGIAKAQVGDLVGTGSSAVLTSLSTLDPIKVVFAISEAEYLSAAARIQESLSKPIDDRPEIFELVLADGSVFQHKARLLSVDRQVNTATGTIQVNALAKNPGNVLRPGLFARARVLGKPIEAAVVVPQRAVQEIQGSYQVGVVGAEAKAEIRPVKLGPRTGSDWVIASGLKAGENVIVEGLQKVRTGAPVSAKPWTPPAATSAEAVQ
jgi:membrane fusion protein (multidrug efflux system)